MAEFLNEPNYEETVTEVQLKHAHNIIDQIFKKYENDPYMKMRSYNYICFQLPQLLDNIKKDHEQRIQRIEDLTNEQSSFVNSFLLTYQYFYVSATENFFFYDGIRYKVYNEDDILHHILSSIRKGKQLMCWKHKTKFHIMKKIRENSLLKSVPESETIQNVIDTLYPTLFQTRAEAKYFLCILGDNILKKNQDLVHFIDAKAKNFIRELNTISQIIIGVNLAHTFKHKYYEHDYANCRILKINQSVAVEHLWGPILSSIALDLICVACHYSIRYNSSDEFLLTSSNDSTLIENVFYMKTLKPEVLVNMFIDEYLQLRRGTRSHSLTDPNEPAAEQPAGPPQSVTQITWRNMQYLWKQYLDSKNLPNIVFQQTLKNILIQSLPECYKESQDSFIGICSKHIPAIHRFLSFWEETITLDETAYNMDFEISELCYLLKKWCENKNEAGKNMNDKQILDLISHFFPDVEIVDEKYIYKIKCSLWNKELEIQMGLDNLKQSLREKYNIRLCQENSITTYNISNTPINYTPTNEIVSLDVTLNRPVNQNIAISIYDAYKSYCKYANGLNGNHEQIVSKGYFEKYVLDHLNNYIIELKYISMEWVL